MQYYVILKFVLQNGHLFCFNLSKNNSQTNSDIVLRIKVGNFQSYCRLPTNAQVEELQNLLLQVLLSSFLVILIIFHGRGVIIYII